MVTVNAESFFSFEDVWTTAERVESLEAVAVDEVEMVLLLLVWNTHPPSTSSSFTGVGSGFIEMVVELRRPSRLLTNGSMSWSSGVSSRCSLPFVWIVALCLRRSLILCPCKMLAERAEQRTTSGSGRISFSSSLTSSSTLRGGLAHLLIDIFETFGWASNWRSELILTGLDWCVCLLLGGRGASAGAGSGRVAGASEQSRTERVKWRDRWRDTATASLNLLLLLLLSDAYRSLKHPSYPNPAHEGILLWWGSIHRGCWGSIPPWGKLRMPKMPHHFLVQLKYFKMLNCYSWDKFSCDKGECVSL